MKIFSLLCIAILFTNCGRNSPESRPSPKPTAKPEKKLPKDNPLQVIADDEGTLSRNGVFVAKLEWLSQPIAETYLKARLVLSTPERAAPRAVSGIEFDPQMPSMGHGTLTDDQKIQSENGSAFSYIIEGIFLIMGGPWEIYISANVDGANDKATIKIDIP